MTDNAKIPDDDSLITDEAIAWFVVLQGPDAEAKQDAFSAWIELSPAHAAAFERIAAIHRGASVLQRSKTFGPRRMDHSPKMVLVATVLIITLLLLGPFALSYLGPRARPEGAFQRTLLVGPAGTIRTVRLVEGTQITLDASARVAVNIDENARNFSIEAGRARFTFAPDRRPFSVTAAGGLITGAQAEIDFAVNEPNVVAVTLWKGEARAEPRNAHLRSAALIVPLRAGKTTWFRAADFRQQQNHLANAADNVRDWPEGWADYRAVSLARLADVVNSYGNGPKLIIEDPAVARLQVAGRFRVTDASAVSTRLEEVFDLATTYQDGNLLLGPRRKIYAPH